MTIPAGRSDGGPAPTAAAMRPATIAIIGTIATLQLATLLLREVNWDEFHFLSLVFDYRRGELHRALQTFHVHLFSWLTLWPGHEVEMIVAGRSVMWLLYMATLWFLYQTASVFVPGAGALWATTAYATILFVAQHATSFRADPIITALLMGALFGLTRERLSLALLVAVCLAVALAGLISIKSVFYAPIFAAVACLRLAQSPRGVLLRDMGIALVVAAICFAGALAWHAALLGTSPGAAAGTIAGASQKQFADAGLFPGFRYLIHSLFGSPLQWAAILAGAAIAAQAAMRSAGVSRLRALTMASFASPLLLIAFYRNSFPYFYVFMLAPTAILAGATAGASAFAMKRARLVPFLFLAFAVLQFFVQSTRTNWDQQALVAAVHELFPEPVPYLDRAGMIASYPNAGFLMSTWWIESYRQRGRPVISRAIEEKKPLFLIVSGYPFTAALETDSLDLPDYKLLPADAAALRENYIPHWGPLWVAGKHLGAADEGEFSVLIPGDYTVESDGPVEIDGQNFDPGDVVMLGVGDHGYAGGNAVLRYGRNLAVPAGDPPAAVFTGF